RWCGVGQAALGSGTRKAKAGPATRRAATARPETESLRMWIKTRQFRKMFHILVMNWKVPCFQRLGEDRGCGYGPCATVEEGSYEIREVGRVVAGCRSGRHHHRRSTYFLRLRQPIGNSGRPGF